MITLRIGSPEILEAVNFFHPDKKIILEELNGWDDLPEVSRATYERVNSDGDFSSKYSRRKSKVLDVTILLKGSASEHRALRDKLAVLTETNDLIQLEVISVEDSDTITERSDAYISSGIIVKKVDDVLIVNIPFKTVSPWKQRAINGGAFSPVL